MARWTAAAAATPQEWTRPTRSLLRKQFFATFKIVTSLARGQTDTRTIITFPSQINNKFGPTDHERRREVLNFVADLALVRRISELESQIVTLEDQITALTQEKVR